MKILTIYLSYRSTKFPFHYASKFVGCSIRVLCKYSRGYKAPDEIITMLYVKLLFSTIRGIFAMGAYALFISNVV
jgi:hypothetical protein